MQHGRRDVGQTAARTHLRAALREPFTDGEHVNEIEGVRGVRTVELQVPHLLRVTVIGADHRLATDLLDRGQQLTYSGVGRLARLDRCRDRARVADHVGIGVVDRDESILA